jgi:thymidylate kinase
MKVIIIEGTDNVGKDSLISKILEEFPTNVEIFLLNSINILFL